MKQETVFLKGNEILVTQSDENAYRIISGKVFVYIAPWRNNAADRRSFLYEAVAGEVIPGFSFRDIDYCEWRFVLVAADKAEIQIMHNASTSVLQRRFCEKIKTNAYQTEGFHNSIIDRYRQSIVAEDSFIERSQNNREKAHADINELINQEISSDRPRPKTAKIENALYNAVVLLCRRCKINIVPYKKLAAACGKDITVDAIARLSHFPYREITLPKEWYRKDLGALLIFDKKDRPHACLPNRSASYSIYDPEAPSPVSVTKKNAADIQEKAYIIYRTLPFAPLKARDILFFCAAGIRRWDIVFLLFLSVLSCLAGLIVSAVFQNIFDTIVPRGETADLLIFGCVSSAAVIAAGITALIKRIIGFKAAAKTAEELQNAVIYRLFHLPQSFFRQFETADLAQRTIGVARLAYVLTGDVIASAGAFIGLIVFLLCMPFYSVQLTAVGLPAALGYGIIYYWISSASVRHKKRADAYRSEAVSKLYRLLNGITAVRMAGAEDKAMLEYFKPYVKERNTEEQIVKSQGINAALSCVISIIFLVAFYCVTAAGNESLSLGSFVAFNLLFTFFFGCYMQIVKNAVSVKREQRHINRVKPIFQTAPETDDEKELPDSLKGDIKTEDLIFSYEQNGINVINGISLHIKPGEKLGIVGPSGCGKSTLLKLLTGIETPVSGTIYYDGKNILSLNRQELRKRFGVVMQDGKLIAGSIYENITVTAPNATVREVKETLRSVGLEKDIREMPMGVHTVLGEKGETLSGGQKQRILLARALISKPDIIFLDEATSALDNQTQRLVTETIANLAVTGVIIAHRLSTVVHCDRIIVMNKGKIAETGTFSELMAQKGLFYQLASEQIV